MSPTRREFLRWAGGLSLAGLVGCEPLAQLGFAPPADAAAGPFEAPISEVRDGVSRVIERLSFGVRPGEYARVARLGVDAYIEEQLAPERIDDRPCEWRIRRLESLGQPAGELFEYREEFLLRELSRGSVLRAVYSRRQLYEVMVEFWSDHFNIDWSKGDCRWLKAADDRDVIRRHALGRFPDLLRASALSPAMLWYLDGRANRKASDEERPNENYARELLELHTLGVDGGYTQDDVMEVARCLTGWTVRSEEKLGKGRVEFRPEWHDDAEKRVLGQTIPAGGGPKDVERVLELAGTHPSTADFIARKLCRRFIAEDPPVTAVETVAAAFRASRGDIRETLRALFNTEGFRAASVPKFKRPFRFVVSALRATNADTDGDGEVLDYLGRMGQPPFQYATPDGYPEEAAPWMGTLLWRWHFAAALAEGRLKGARVDWVRLREDAGSEGALMAHLLGRSPTADERRAATASGVGPAFLLAAPAFQRY